MISEQHNPFTAPTLSREPSVRPKTQMGRRDLRHLFEDSVVDAKLFPEGTFRTGIRLYLIGVAATLISNLFQHTVFITMGINWGPLAPFITGASHLIWAASLTTIASMALMTIAAPQANRLAATITLLLLVNVFSPYLTFNSPNNYWILLRVVADGAVQLAANLLALLFFVRFTTTRMTATKAKFAATGLVVFWLVGSFMFYAQVIQWPDFFSRNPKWVTAVSLILMPFWAIVGVLQMLVTRDALASQVSSEPISDPAEQVFGDRHLQHSDTP